MDSDNPTPDGFTKVLNRRRGHKKSSATTKTNLVDLSKPSTSNSFAALASDDIQDPDNIPSIEKESSKEKKNRTPPQSGEKVADESAPLPKSITQAWSFLGMEIDDPNPSVAAEKESVRNF